MRSTFLRNRLPSFWILQFAGWFGYWVMIYITFLSIAAEGSFLRLLHVKFVRSLIGFGLSTGLRFIYKRFANNRSFTFTAILTLFASAVFASLWTVFGNTYAWLTKPAFNLQATLAQSPRETLDYTMTLLSWSALYFGIKYWQAWQAEREQSLKASVLANEARLEALRYQLNPHFLFNALNSIRASIDEDSKRARRMVTHLAEILRYSLDSGVTHVSLRAELAAIRSYVAIEKVRFEDRLDVQFDVEPATENYQVPGFLIYPLVENAIKHGMKNSRSPLKIHLTARELQDFLYLEVANTGSWSARAVHEKANSYGMGIGLNNIRQRVAQLYNGQSVFEIFDEGGWVRVVIKIPKA